ncbi:complement C1q-like protein 4 [Saccostrea cucullata]|uniref:complement C1q-like protein 4 n=1 Tax=Saccostrea cuccullata TaxID=36930 RepID=UPI002ED451E2
MESRLLKLEHDVDVLSSENRRLKMKNAEQDNEIEILQNANKQLHELIDEILERENEDLKTLITSNKNRSSIHFHLSESTNMTSVKRNDHAKQPRLLVPNAPRESVAFYAYINSVHSSDLPTKHISVYDTVITNYGNGYHKEDGIFTVPQHGIYVFPWTVAVADGEWINAEIVLNGSPFGSITADTGEAGSYDGGFSTGIAIKEVSTGDHVFIRTVTHDSKSQIYSGSAARTSFAGWILF